ncbi:protein kinase [Streptomyces sp. NPDC001851]|uniref:serine/threonine-protein kinase n=1 Tax=Streptomyces sp. NPDC001851 TaxID=3154529 RepID=UPI003321AB7D
MGEVFAGRYELADPIGRGGVGAVWRAWDHRRRRYVAAKVLQQRDAHSLLRFVREQALRIDHPHVLAPASWAADDDKVLFTMDLVAGGSLVHLVGDYGPLPPAFVCTLLDQLLSGLAAVHAEGVIHRDIKPANILLEATGTGRPRLRLSDLGIAMRLGEPRLTETNLVVGTPGYLAPEQMLGSEPDFPADLFAVGLVALYLLEGAKPDAKALVQYFAERGTPGPPKGVPEPLWQVVATLLQPDPAARFRTATGARKALAAAAELLPEPEPDDELIEIFDQLPPLPPGFAPDGPLKRASGVALGLVAEGDADAFPHTDADPDPRTDADPDAYADTGTDGGPGAGSPAAADRSRPARTSSTLSTPGTESTTGSLSDTGSFRLPPPQEQVPRAAGAPAPDAPYVPQPSFLPQPPLHQPYFSSHTPSPSPVQAPHVDASTASYTAQDVRVPAPARHRARRARRSDRPGPPARAAIPLLLLALACYAVGFWALTRV